MMTEPEAQELGTRLTRIWEPGPFLLGGWSLDAQSDPSFQFWTIVDVGVEVVYSQSTYRSVLPTRDALRAQTGHLSWSEEFPVISTTDEKALYMNREAEYAQFADEWMHFFRRGCWLSGCAIEASAHEKMEWMQRFSREEVEAWELRI